MTLYLRDIIVAKNTAYKCVLTTFCPFCKEMYFSRDNGKNLLLSMILSFFLIIFHSIALYGRSSLRGFGIIFPESYVNSAWSQQEAPFFISQSCQFFDVICQIFREIGKLYQFNLS